MVLIFIIVVVVLVICFKKQKKSKTYREVIEQADAGDPNAEKYLSALINIGKLNNSKINKIRKEIYTAKAELGDSDAMIWLALLANGSSEAYKWYKMAADKNNTKAMCAIALGYTFNPTDDAPYNLKLGVNEKMENEWLEKAAKLGCVDAMCTLGLNSVIHHNIEKAIEWYAQALESKELTECQYVEISSRLADIYSNHSYTEQYNIDKAIEILENVISKNYDVEEMNQHEYIETRDKLGRVAQSLGWAYKTKYKDDASFNSKIGRMWVYAICLDSDLREYLVDRIHELGFGISDQEFDAMRNAANRLTYLG